MGLWSAVRRQAAYWWEKNRNKKPLTERMKASAVRKGRRFVLGTPFVHWCINRVLQVVAAELFLWILVWWASDLCVIENMNVFNFVVPCVISGVAQLAVRDVVIDAMGKHTSDLAALVQRTLQKRWDQTAFWVTFKSCAGVATAVVVIIASRAGLLSGPILEVATLQVLLTMFVVDLIRNKNHPVRQWARNMYEYYFQRPQVTIMPRRRYVDRRGGENTGGGGTGNMRAIVDAAAEDLLDEVIHRVPVHTRFFNVEREEDNRPTGGVRGMTGGGEEEEEDGELEGEEGEDEQRNDGIRETTGSGEEEEEERNGGVKEEEEADIAGARALVDRASRFVDSLTVDDVARQLPDELNHYFSPIIGKWTKLDEQ